MKRREFFKKAGIAFGGIPFWTGILSEELAAKIPSDIKITEVKTIPVGIDVYVKIYTNKGVTGLKGGSDVHCCPDTDTPCAGPLPARSFHRSIWQPP